MVCKYINISILRSGRECSVATRFGTLLAHFRAEDRRPFSAPWLPAYGFRKPPRDTMKMNEAAFGSELVVELGTNGNGHSRAQSTHDELYQAAFKAGLATGQEAGYRQGYQAGFA